MWYVGVETDKQSGVKGRVHREGGTTRKELGRAKGL